METLKIKAEVDMDTTLVKLGFTKGKQYYNYQNISVRMSDRIICFAFEASPARYTRSYKLELPKILLTMMAEGVLE